MKLLSSCAVLGVSLLFATGLASAQSFPSQPVRIVIGFPPGGAIDTIARVIAPLMAQDLGQNVLVENRAGAAGMVGMQAVARAPADGHMLFMGTMGNFSITPALVKDLPYDVSKDFEPVTQVASTALVLFAHPKFPASSVAELVAYAKARAHKVNFSSSGNGGIPHMAGEMFNTAAVIQMTHVPYRGSAPSITDLVSGQVDLTFEPAAAGLSHVSTGRLKVLATTGSERLKLLPDVPTVSETLPGFTVKNWFGIAAPAGTAPDRIARLHKSITSALRQPETLAKLSGLGVEPVGDTSAQFGAYIKSETERWQRLIVKNGIKTD